nr:tyrosine-type recombinase/integrase [uncultured Carboxylicivirga sp.]
MPRRKRIIVLPRLNDCKGDINKRWFIEYQVRNHKTDKMHRFRIYEGFETIVFKTKLETIQERQKHAQSIINEYTYKLKNGWTPFKDEDVIYEDEIDYHNLAQIYGRKKKSNITIRSLMSDFLTYRKREVKPKTYESYQSKIRLFCMWLEKNDYGDLDVESIDNKIILEFFNWLIDDRKLSKLTLEKYEQNINRLFEYLISNKKVIENPVFNVPKLPRTCDNAAKPIMKNDIEKFKMIIQGRDPQLWLALQFEFYCFIRPGSELRLMRIAWIDFFSGTITIPANIAKNGKQETVIVPSQFLTVLTQQYQLQNYARDLYVFGRNKMPGTEPLGKNTLRNRFNSFRDELGLSKEYKFYSWKHTGAVLASNAGVPTKDLQMQMRHHSLDITDKYLRKMKGTDSEHLKNRFPEI